MKEENMMYKVSEVKKQSCGNAEKHRFVCADDFGAMMSCVYEAWRWENRGFAVELAVEGEDNYQLFCTEHQVAYDEERAEKVIRSVRNKISDRALELVYNCAMSDYPEKLEVIYRFMRLGFAVGYRAVNMFTEESVIRIFGISRQVGNEAHKFIEFVRFTCWDDGILCAVIEPKSNVLTMIADHFADRMPSENWMIVDKRRKLAVLHPADGCWYLRQMTGQEFRTVLDMDRDSEEYALLWKTFFHHVAIEQRKNPRCQSNFLPKWYRENMTEFH